MPASPELLSGFERLVHYIESEDYSGYDPYDGLRSPLFRLPLLRTNKPIRFLSQQLIKRCPFNPRPVLGIRKSCNPVTLGLCIQGYVSMLSLYREKKRQLLDKIELLMTRLENSIASGYHGACWGYDFDWEARYATIPAYQPTVVATGIITNALFQYYLVSGSHRAIQLCQSAAEFVVNDLNQITFSDNSLCFSYSPFDRQTVFNASLKGVRLLSQVYSVTNRDEYRKLAARAVAFVIRHQQADGSWSYAASGKGHWIDNYHTGYVLDCLDDYEKYCKDSSVSSYKKKGFDFYQQHFIMADGHPRFYHNNPYPVDCTAAAQSILTLCRFGAVELATRVGHFMLKTMQHPQGYFYFRKYRFYVQRTSFMRWSQAWMMAALAHLMTSQS
jgi:hypothetical protein